MTRLLKLQVDRRLLRLICIFVSFQIGFVPTVAHSDVIVYQLQGGSQLSFSGSTILVPNGLGFSAFPIVAKPGSSLTSALTGVFSSEVGSTTLTSGGAMVQVSDILADIRNTTNADVGNIDIFSANPISMSIDQTTSPIPVSFLKVGSGAVDYSIGSPPFVGSGVYPLNGAAFNISNIQYGMQGTARTASFDLSANAILATNVSNVFISANINGTILGIQAVPEPSSALLVAIVSFGLLNQRRRSPGRITNAV